jgi:micrococcal nuclease
MKIRLTILAASAASFLFLAGLLLFRTDVFSWADRNGDVVFVYHVIDGDTVRVRFSDGREKKVRLLGIDTPEMGDSRENVRIQANLAKRFTFYHLFGKEVRLTYDWDREDDFGRLLAYIWMGDLLFNRKIISDGFAFAYRGHPYELQKEFVRLERSARQQGRGLWGEQYPQVNEGEARSVLGRIAEVRFGCAQIRFQRGFTFFETSNHLFAALIPQSEIDGFNKLDFLSYEGREMVVWGFVEEFRKQIQIMVVSPDQIL